MQLFDKRSSVVLDLALSLFFLTVSTLLGTLFYRLDFSDSTIMMSYLLGVLMIAVGTSHRVYSLVCSVVSVLLFNYFFVDPRFSLQVLEPGYPVVFLALFLTSFITSTLAVRLKDAARQAEENAREREAATVQIENERLRSTLLRAISHDLRTPLTSISGNASNLLSHEDSFDETTRQSLYRSIYEDSLWLNHMVENLLASTRLENGEAKLSFSTEVLEDILEEAASHVRAFSPNHQILVESPSEMILVRADARLIMQLLINLLNNAVKYTPEGSTVRVTAEKRGGTAYITVADNGPGVPDEHKPKIFDMFYTGDQSVSDGRRSLGFGLALCKTIIKVHGCEISVSDNVPHGAVFTFSLPAEEVPLNG